jgi:AAHS family 4-hydroxybenzoate transporter-like MFS transporter
LPTATDLPGAPGNEPVDVARFIDAQPVGRFHVQLLLMCAAVLFTDGFDTQAIGYVAPDLAREWHLGRGALGPVFSVGLFGLMIGALLLGPIADRIGRKRIIVFSTLAFGLGTLTTVFASDLQWLMVIRFLTGLGLGGAMPNAVAVMAEFSPHRRRATLVMVMFCGFSIGAALGGLLAAALIPVFGWRSVFVVGGTVPLLLAPLLGWALPESTRFLARADRDQARLARLLKSIAPAAQFAANVRFVIDEPRPSRMPVVELFAHGRTLSTLLIWVVFFMSLLDLYLLSNWLPSLLNELGASVSLAAVIGSLFQVGGVIGALTLGSFIDRFSFRALAVTYFGAAVAIVCIGFSSHFIALAAVAIACAGFGIVGGQTGSNALAATFYPTTVRSTGVGWALGIGRIGSIVGPLAGGIMLAQRADVQTLFISAAVPALLGAAAAFGLSRIARRRGDAGVRGARDIETKGKEAECAQS